MRTLLLSTCLVLLASGCDVARDVQERKAAEQEKIEANELRDHVEQPVDRAKAANDPVIEANERRDQQLEDSGG